MYQARVIFNDYKNYDVEIEDQNIEAFMMSFSQKVPFFTPDKSVGFWLPTENVRCVYTVRIPTKEEPCLESPPLETENVSTF